MSTISFHNVGFHVKMRNREGSKKCCGDVINKPILSDVSGIFRPGMNAILGPTGSGKTTLLDVLSDRIDKSGVTGKVLVNGIARSKNFKLITGYVVQDDVVMGTLTVRESITFSANLRLPGSTTLEEKKRRVNEVIEELGLVKCADSKIGTELIRGISGGERKRVSIGMELIISPSIIFLDEPTTGLDASTANSVMSLLHGLSLKGQTVIFSIHQPRYAIFKYFDTLSLLGSGRTIFHGPANQALDYFEGIGFRCEDHNNPPDFFMDVITEGTSLLMKAEKQKQQKQQNNNNNNNNNNSHVVVIDDEMDSNELDEEVTNGVNASLSDLYSRSEIKQKISEELDDIEKNQGLERFKDPGLDPNSQQKQLKLVYPTSPLVQTMYVCARTIKNLIRNPQTFALQIMISIFFAVIVGVIYLQLGDKFDSAIQNRMGAFLFIVMNQVFSNMSVVELFIRERHIFIHESASGYYRVSSYFFSKVLCDIIPMRVLPVTIFSPICYFMIGLQTSADKFFIFYLTLFLTSMAGASVGIMISSSVSVLTVANLIIVLIYVLMMLFGGLLVNLETMADWLSWLQYLSIVRYSMNALSINELKGLVLKKTINNGTEITIPGVGEEFLRSQGIKYETDWDFWQNILALIIMIIAFLILAYVQLRRMKKLK